MTLSPFDPHRPTILVADDDPVNRKLLSVLAERNGWQVWCAEDGEVALGMWQQGSFDLVLLDMEMPHVDGLEVARRIRAAEQRTGQGRVPLVAMTAHARDDVLERCMQAGMDDCLSKPFHLKEFVEICRKAIDRQFGTGYKQ